MTHRIERINTEIRRELSELIQRHIKDPRIDSFVTVTEVITSADLRYAKVYVSSIAGQEQEASITGVLNDAAGFLRTELARTIKIRRTPELTFIWDNSIERGDRILRLLDEISGENPD